MSVRRSKESRRRTYDDRCSVKNNMGRIHWIRRENTQCRLDTIAQHVLEPQQNHQHQDERQRQDRPDGHARLGVSRWQRPVSSRLRLITSVGVQKS